MIRQSGKILVITDDRAFLALLKKTVESQTQQGVKVVLESCSFELGAKMIGT